MTSDVPIRCKCGRVRGVVREVGPRTVNRAVCYCHDCRAYVHWLERDDLLDARGGSEIIQLARARLEIAEGIDQVRCMRLSPKGMHRWYAECCRTPLGNTIPRIPYLGVVRGAFEVSPANDASTFGETIATNVGSAVGGPPPGAGLTFRGVAHLIRLLANWVIRRLGHPTPFFDRNNRPTVTPHVLTARERQKLREHSRA
jgi:uncharacterized protein DUF6151